MSSLQLCFFDTHTFWLIGHMKAMSLSNYAQQKAFCRQKVELNPDFSGVDSHPTMSSGETEIGPELDLEYNPNMELELDLDLELTHFGTHMVKKT